MLAGPIINVVVMLSTWFAFSGHGNRHGHRGQPAYQMGSVGMVALRVGLGYLVAVVHQPGRRVAISQARQQSADPLAVVANLKELR